MTDTQITNKSLYTLWRQEKSECLVQVNNNQRYQKSHATSAEISYKHGEVPLSESLKKEEREVLEKDYQN